MIHSIESVVMNWDMVGFGWYWRQKKELIDFFALHFGNTVLGKVLLRMVQFSPDERPSDQEVIDVREFGT
jgi:hypothetical protein